MEINTKKTKILVLCKKKKAKKLNIKQVAGIDIQETYKYLWVEIDCSLTLESSISQIKSKTKTTSTYQSS